MYSLQFVVGEAQDGAFVSVYTEHILRKETGLEITDRISVVIEPQAEAAAAVESFGELIKTQVLANDITLAENNGADVEFDEFNLHIEIKKI